jgi:hypothetical protein
LLGTQAAESQGQLSPDGKWLAYTSDESARSQVYVRPFPWVSKIAWQVSVEGGREPRWLSDSGELFFLMPNLPEHLTLMATKVEGDGGGGLRFGPPQKLFEIHARMYNPRGNMFVYSPHPDGQRFLVNALPDADKPTVNVITNWQRGVAGNKSR